MVRQLKLMLVLLAVFFVSLITVPAQAGIPALTVPATSNLGANQVTLTVQASENGTGYITLLPGSSTACGTGAQVKDGLDSNGSPAFRRGSLKLSANSSGSYTIANLIQTTNYTACFTADDGTSLQSTPATANLTTVAAATYSNPVWGLLGNPGFTSSSDYHALAYAPDGTPYLAYSYNTSGTVLKWDGAGWVTVGSPGFFTSDYPMSLVFAPNGTPYIAYEDSVNGMKATVKKFDGNDWAPVGDAGFSSGTMDFMALAIAPDGTPYTAFTEFESNITRVMRYDGSSWTPVGGIAFSDATRAALVFSLKFSPAGVPYISYLNYVPGEASGMTIGVKRLNSDSWELVGNPAFPYFPEGGIAFPLAFAPDGTPYLVYPDAANASKATVMKFNGSSWDLVGSAGFTPVAGWDFSLAFAPDGAPYLAYAGSGPQSGVMKYTGGSWITVGDAGIMKARYTSLAFAPDGTPTVAFRDLQFGNKITVMRFANPPVPPVLTSISPSSGLADVNTNVTITGVGFSNALRVMFGSKNAISFVVNSDSQITAVAPTAATGDVVDVTVTTYNGTSATSSADLFTYGKHAQNAIFTAAPVIFIGGTGVVSAHSSLDDALLHLPATYSSLTPETCTITSSYTIDTPFTGSPFEYVSMSLHKITDYAVIKADKEGTCTIAVDFPETTDHAAVRGTQSITIIPAVAPPLTAPTLSNLGANQATLTFQASYDSIGWFTLLAGSNVPCGSANQVKAGLDSANNTAYRRGSLSLIGSTPGHYTVRNLSGNTQYTICFIADNSMIQPTPVAVNFTTNAAKSFALPVWVVSTYQAEYQFPSVGGISFAPDGALYVAYNKDDSNTVYSKTHQQVDRIVGNNAYHLNKFNLLTWTGYIGTVTPVFAPDGTLSIIDARSVQSFISYGGGKGWNKKQLTTEDIFSGSVAFAPNGELYVGAKVVPHEFGGIDLDLVRRFDGTNWVDVGTQSLLQNPGKYPYNFIAFAPDGSLYLAGNQKILRFDGSDWVTVGELSADITAFAFAPDGTLWVAAGSPSKIYKFNGSNWFDMGSDGTTSGRGGGTSIAIAPDGTPVIAGSDGIWPEKVYVKKLSGSSWVSLADLDLPDNMSRLNNSRTVAVTFSPDGTPYVAYAPFSPDTYKVLRLVDTAQYVTYNGNGNSSGTVPVDTTGYALNATATVLGNSGALAKNGYVFNGWNTAADGSGTSYQPGATFVMAASSTLYAQWAAPVAPPSGLVSWWRGEGNGLDVLGTNNATLHSTTNFSFASGKVGQAFSFSGAISEYLDAPSSASLNFGTGGFAIATWIKSNDNDSYRRLVTKRTGGTWYSLALNGGKAFFEIAAGVNCTSSTTVADGKWHHIVVSRDQAGTSPRKYHLYIDGVENTSLADSGLNLDNSAPLELGKWYTESHGGTYAGLMDEVQIFNRSLTAAEIHGIYNAGSAGLALTPTVTNISPSSGFASGGTSVTITGTGLSGATAVNFGATDATGFSVTSDIQATATSPAGVIGQTVDVTVTTPGGTSATNSADQFTYTLQYQAKNQTTGNSYTTLAEAITAESTSIAEDIRAYGGQFDGAITLATSLNLYGGYDDLFSVKGSLPTTLNGSLTLSGGTAKVDSVTVKGVLTIKGGSLQVNGVTVQ
ncbi:MAG: IPT/TIG domain-containing protein [Trichlorobacter sp.]|uniref:LamG-like jellyroll fold domain-containing protein n=1 Tax=Trichlorobacter sp. TaxID=2911007 RepID=UPI0025641B27|nr:LamG-like jellyroll fold domain-containing protein [Trichlorobacter sp.]MDK9716480.1 IPT/TIG domain-containing protein [Trichlorobacter sp.]